MGHDPQSDIPWEAFRYVAGEMDSQEQQQFEDRLLSDQSLREALAHAVELTEAVALVACELQPLEVARPNRRRRNWAKVAIASALAASVAIVAASWFRHHQQQPEPVVAVHPSSSDPAYNLAAVAMTWTQLRQAERQQPADDLHELPSLHDWAEAELDSELDTELDPDAVAFETLNDVELTVPAWLIAAAEVGVLPTEESPN